ncbi:hypothetical protein [Leptospira weilii]|uniref:Uncharacterized protein n=1 Tax=Leptospira weilii str. UI 13098 TaxID=1088542 RepID=M6Q5B9_9LEPT|nr:hypothetical protein [Leptospira weilii]EMN87903.1 hypothetical protein LEP1GSC108_0772 [Leptospira weilii str. UI 13098]OMI17402.1 hypothetical protein BUQ74_10490 [Leptospira weilii serovar Heyan]
MKPGDKVKIIKIPNYISEKSSRNDPTNFIFSKELFFPVIYLLASFEIITRILFQENGLIVLYRWIISGENLLIPVFLIIPVFVFIAMIAQQCKTIYLIKKGNLDSYIFIGDRLHEGALVYAENDPSRNILFASEVNSSHPSPYFNELYKKLILLKEPSGILRKTDNQNMTSLIVRIIVALAALSFSFSGVCIILKTYAYTQLPLDVAFASLSHGPNLGDFLPFLSTLSPFLFFILFSVTLFFVTSFIWIKAKIRNFTNTQKNEGDSQFLPHYIKNGSILTGRILKSAAEKDGSSDRTSSKKHQIYLIEFTDVFNTPVYINYHIIEENGSQKQPWGQKTKLKQTLDDWKKTGLHATFKVIPDANPDLLTVAPVL